MTPFIVLSPLFSECTQLEGCYVYLSLVPSQGGGIHTEEEFGPCILVCCLFSRAKDSKFGPIFDSEDFLGFGSLYRDWILKC